MQISRHWRLNPLRYRLQGVRYENGEVSLLARPQPPAVSAGSKEGGTSSSREQEATQEKTDHSSSIAPCGVDCMISDLFSD